LEGPLQLIARNLQWERVREKIAVLARLAVVKPASFHSYKKQIGRPMTEDIEPTQAVTVVTRALNWAYNRATAAIPGLGGAADLAEKHLKSCGDSPKKAIDDLIAWQAGYAGATGFVSNIGGVMTMPVAVPANLASVLLIQLRMVAAIAHLRGYKINDERVRAMAFVCLTGNAAARILQEFGISLGTKLSTHLITRISCATLVRINQAVGFRLVTKAGTTGLINLTKLVPIAGGLVGGALDATVTRGIGAVAKKAFKPVDDNTSTNPTVMPEPEPPSGP
jgi:uncharacterized protein (DUF697 family)